MNNGIRIIDSGMIPAINTFALDEAIMHGLCGGLSPETLHFYIRQTPVVSVGRAQNVQDTVDIDYCRKNNIDIIRRTSGGGTIYTDSGQLIFSLSFKPGIHRLMASEIIYEKICGGVADSLKELGINAKKQGINDIIVNGRKLSGSGIRRFGEIILFQSTLIFEMDKEAAFFALKISDDKLKAKGITRPEEMIITLKEILGSYSKTHLLEKVKSLIIKSMKNLFSKDLYHGEFTQSEISQAENLMNKYSSEEWNFKR